ncbi:cytochrome-c peroxidase [Rhodohalobacter sp. 614A]|uniref:cytochrome-c peroxidase n=1 Tax=Rhodohalobacter sp. 614A TaxID=2908649 RepID=UPI001F47BFB3|nr:cytochrome c peroxidase [Rhodohalobacter sp. 614A]
MTKIVRFILLLTVTLFIFISFSVYFTACSETEEWQPEAAAIFQPVPPEAPVPEDNPMTPAKIDLGHKLFFEPKLSRSGIISCNTCHVVGAAGVDHRDVAIGEHGRLGPRNTPTVYNAAFLRAQFLDGRAATLEEQAVGPIQTHVEMDLTPEEAMERLEKTGYRPYFREAFPEESNYFTFDNLAKAIAAFERTLITHGSPFDDYLQGDREALTEDEVAGLQLFMDNGCMSCHNGPLLGGQTFMLFSHAAQQEGDDMGRYNVTGQEADKYVFRVAPLRNVEMTYPYFHDGSAETLEEAVSIMGTSQLDRRFNEQEVNQIVAFLKTLTGEFATVPHPVLPR